MLTKKIFALSKVFFKGKMMMTDIDMVLAVPILFSFCYFFGRGTLWHFTLFSYFGRVGGKLVMINHHQLSL